VWAQRSLLPRFRFAGSSSPLAADLLRSFRGTGRDSRFSVYSVSSETLNSSSEAILAFVTELGWLPVVDMIKFGWFTEDAS
jgi:hypothetical protein